MSRPHPSVVATASCMLIAFSVTAALAAPVAPDDSAAVGASDGGPAAGALGGAAPLPDSTSASARTVDLLIELQPRSAGLQFNDRERLQSRELRIKPVVERREAAAAEAAAPPPGGLFGAGATPTVASKRASVVADSDWKPPTGARGVSGGGDGPRPAGVDIDARWLWLPQELVRFVRDNREFVIGAAIGLLALLWAGSVAMSNNNRR